MKRSQLQFDTRKFTRKASEQHKAVVKRMLQTDCQPCNPMHDEPVPHKQVGGR